MKQQALTDFPLRQAHTVWRQWVRSGGAADLDLGIISSFTADGLKPYLGCALLSSGWAPQIRIAPFNQIFQTLSDPQTAFGIPPPGILLILARLDELVSEELSRFCAGDFSAWSSASKKLSDLAIALAETSKTWSGTLVVATLPPPTTPEFDLLNLDRLGVVFFERASESWRRAIAAVDGIRVLDVDALVNDFGARHAFDSRKWYLYRQPFSEQFLFELGNQAARLISATRRASAKCAVIDCDNTLCGGIIGEDGLDGIRLGDEFPGSAYCDFQKLLLHWSRQGVFLAVCSKNNPEDVRQVFRNHQAMILREGDISAWAVDWRTKSEQLSEVASQLNIGTDALVFFDDSSYEIAEVRSHHPEIRCIEVPAAPESVVTLARRAMPFDKIEITHEDILRVERQAVETQRNQLRQSLPPEEFLRSLDLRVDMVSAGHDNLARITQLINKTNQFRLTDIRVTQEQVSAMVQSADYLVRAAVVKDKFGDYGLTGVGILERRGGDWHLSAFLLSCRVLGRGVETSFLAALASEVSARGGNRITAEFYPTEKNAVAANFLECHGFRKLESGLWWHSAVDLAAKRTAGTALTTC